MSELIHYVSDANFENEVLKSELPVFVYFWAEWCNPCRMLAPVVEQLAETYQGSVKIVKINIDSSEMTAANFGVRQVPTMFMFKDGNAEAVRYGAATKSQLVAFIDSNK